MVNELDNVISETEIKKSISQLKVSRSGGLDRLINEFFIYGIDTFLDF